jgi:hypothetical protein
MLSKPGERSGYFLRERNHRVWVLAMTASYILAIRSQLASFLSGAASLAITALRPVPIAPQFVDLSAHCGQRQATRVETRR